MTAFNKSCRATGSAHRIFHTSPNPIICHRRTYWNPSRCFVEFCRFGVSRHLVSRPVCLMGSQQLPSKVSLSSTGIKQPHPTNAYFFWVVFLVGCLTLPTSILILVLSTFLWVVVPPDLKHSDRKFDGLHWIISTNWGKKTNYLKPPSSLPISLGEKGKRSKQQASCNMLKATHLPQITRTPLCHEFNMSAAPLTAIYIYIYTYIYTYMLRNTIRFFEVYLKYWILWSHVLPTHPSWRPVLWNNGPGDAGDALSIP